MSASSAPKACNLLIHLGGEQVAPLCLGARQVEAERHLVVSSEGMRASARGLEEFVGKAASVDFEAVDPFDPVDVRERLIARLQDEPHQSVIVNVTGGPKPMLLGAMGACPPEAVPSFYVQTQPSRRVVWLQSESIATGPLKPAFASVSDFIRIHGEHVADEGYIQPIHEQRKKVTMRLWSHRFAIGKGQRDLVSRKLNPGQPFQWTGKNWGAELDRQMRARITFRKGDPIEFDNASDLAAYLTGGWFEEFCYWKLQPLLKDGTIKDLRINLRTSTDDSASNRELQEIDLAFTDGFALTLVECKAGSVTQAHIQKLENLVQKYGGAFGRGVLAGVFPPYGTTPARIQSSRTVAGIFGGPVPGSLSKAARFHVPGSLQK